MQHTAINPYGLNFNPQVLKDLKKINEEIMEEEQKEDIDEEKILKLREKQLMRGMELGNPLINFNRRHIPW